MKPLILLLIASLVSSHLPAAEKPNVIVILADDLGYADLGFQGFPASRQALTPNIDRLAREGIAFRNGYVAFSTCGPSRHSLLTGRSASRYGIEENGFYSPPSEIIIPRAIRNTGYATAMFGKWHLAPDEDAASKLSPTGRGFDFAYQTTSHDFFMKETPHPKSWKTGGMPGYGPYVTDAITDEAIAFIKANKSKPFFAYIAQHAPHSPFCSKEPLMRRIVEHAPEYRAAYKRMKTHASKTHAPNSKSARKPGFYNAPDFDYGNFKGKDLDQELLRLTYLSMILALDDGVGKILDALEKEGLRDNTLIFFLSDNGGALSRPNDLGGVNLPLRGGKGGVFEGGVRVPFVMSWPGVLPKGVTDTTNVVSSMDIFTTTVELAGGKVPEDRVIDGVNLIPYLTGKKTGNPHETLFFRRLGDGNYSIRHGDLKLTSSKRKGEDIPKVTDTDPFPASGGQDIPKNADTNPFPAGGGLYDIQNDITEAKDTSGNFPGKKQSLQKLYDELTKGFPVPLDKLPGAKPADDN